MARAAHRIAFVGVGWTEATRHPAMSEAAYVLEACRRAAADAGIDPADLDGVNVQPHHGDWDAVPVIRGLGMKKVRFHAVGGSGPAAAARAAEALDSGACSAVVVCKVMNTHAFITPPHEHLRDWTQFELPYGVFTARQWVGFMARRYMNRYGVTPEQIGAIAVVQREHALRHPYAYWKSPLTLEDYLNSRMINDPVRLLDCDIPINGAWAYILTRDDRARGLRQPPVYLAAWAGRPADEEQTWDHMVVEPEEGPYHQGKVLWADTGLAPRDIDVSFVYDGFSYFVPMWMENLGLVGRGEAGDFVAGGDRIRLGGELPTNTHGGNLSGGRWHGAGHLLEAVHQLRGEAGDRQVVGARHAVVTMSLPYFGSACVLSRD
jgi:acetyl-CoA acetyltransferase